MIEKKKRRRLTPQQELSILRKALGYVTYAEDETSAYGHLDLGDSDANEIFGDRELGMRWGCIVEIHGPEGSGKTWLATKIAAIAQVNDPHVYVGKMDLERSNDERFNTKVGINPDRFYLFEPSLAVSLKEMAKIEALRKKRDEGGKLTKLQEETLSLPPDAYEQSAEQLCDEVEAWIKFRHDRDRRAKIVLIIDSVTGMLVSEEDEGKLSDQNMRTKVSLASFLSLLCRRWVRLAANYNVIMLFINQEREAPGVMYGSPIRTTGGRALKFYAVVRVRSRRSSNGRIMKDGKAIGLRSILLNEKNKVGGREGGELAFKSYSRTGKWVWITKDQADKEAKAGRKS